MPSPDVHSDAPAGGRVSGQPVGPDEIDPDLIKLALPRPKIGALTALSVVVLCSYLLFRLWPDLTFSRQQPIAAHTGALTDNRLARLELSPLYSRAVRVRASDGAFGLRAMPAAGHGDKLWIVVGGDASAPVGLDAQPGPPHAFAGRVRRLDQVQFASALRAAVASQTTPAFATAEAARASAQRGDGQVDTVSGDRIAVAAGDRVEFDIDQLDDALVVATLSERLTDASAWAEALTAAGISLTSTSPVASERHHVTFAVHQPSAVATATAQLEAAHLWAARVEKSSKTRTTTWGEWATAQPAAAQPDLIRVFVSRQLPADAHVILVGELPAQYWYVLPLAVTLALFAALFAWALVRALRRDIFARGPREPLVPSAASSHV
jgi:hypothetical protein